MATDKRIEKMLNDLMSGSTLEARKIGGGPDGAEEKACAEQLIKISQKHLAAYKKGTVLTHVVEDENGVFHLLAYLAVPSRHDAEMAAKGIAPAQMVAALLMEESQAKKRKAEASESDGGEPSHEDVPFVATLRA